MKTCYACGETKSDDEFYKKGDKRRRPDALSSYCKTCAKAKVKPRANPKSNWHRTDKARAYNRNHMLMRNFGITVDQYDEMLERQGGVCAICGLVCKSGRRLAVDHDHATGLLRSLLCSGCNTGLGSFRDSPDLLIAAVEYLNSHTRIGSTPKNSLAAGT